MALGLLAAIPAVGLAAIIAAQDYRTHERVAIETVDRLQSVATTRIEAAVGVTGAALERVARQWPGPAAGCDRIRSYADAADRPKPTAVFDAGGALVCDAGAETGLQPDGVGPSDWFQQLGSHPGPAWGMTGDGRAALIAVRTPDGGALATVLPPEWFARLLQPDHDPNEVASWLIDGRRDIVVSTGLAAEALPALTIFTSLEDAGDKAVLAASVGGVPFAYASTRLGNGWLLVGAYRATREHIAALHLLYTRLASLAILLLLGLAVTVLGADLAFGDPLRRLRTALADWQAGADFDERGLASAPIELLEMARSFNQATVSLRQQKAELERAVARQDLLMLEIHHRVKNNLQIVASLLNLQASRIRVPEARAEFQAARDRVRALATLHRHLYAEGEIHTINMASFLAELCGQLFQAMGETPGGRIQLDIQAEDIRLSTDQAVPMALIVTEAVTNAIKYGFPGGRPGSVRVSLAQHAGALDLVIADDGVGIPPGRSETETGTRDGIGLQLIRGFSRQLGATLTVSEQPGTCYGIHMPLVPRARDQHAVGDLAEVS